MIFTSESSFEESIPLKNTDKYKINVCDVEKNLKYQDFSKSQCINNFEMSKSFPADPELLYGKSFGLTNGTTLSSQGLNQSNDQKDLKTLVQAMKQENVFSTKIIQA